MHVVNLFSEAIKNNWSELPCEPVKAVCAITGKESDCIPRKYVVSSGFTNQTVLESADSKFMSVEAFQSLKFRPERSSWFVKKSNGKAMFKTVTRIEIRNILLNQDDNYGIWACYASTTGKKHGVLYSKVNKAGAGFFAKDADIIDCSNSGKVLRWYNNLERFLRLGIGRKVLENLVFNGFVVRKVGYKNWREFETWARNKYRSNLYKFLVYLLPSIAELKEEMKTQEKPVIVKEEPVKKTIEQMSICF